MLLNRHTLGATGRVRVTSETLAAKAARLIAAISARDPDGALALIEQLDEIAGVSSSIRKTDTKVLQFDRAIRHTDSHDADTESA